MGIEPQANQKRCAAHISFGFLDKAGRYDRQLAVMPVYFLLIK
jgi:hypothetical protein